MSPVYIYLGLLAALSVLALIAGYYLTYLAMRAPLSRLSMGLASAYATTLASDSDDLVMLQAAANRAKRRGRLISIGAVVVFVTVLNVYGWALTKVLANDPARAFREYLAFAGLAFAVGAWTRSMLADREITRIDGGLNALLDTRKQIFGSIGDERINEAELAERARAARDEERYRQNVGVPFTVAQLELNAVGIFGDLAWTIAPRVNVLLGRNGFGKTFLLRLMVAALTNDSDRLGQLTAGQSPKPRLRIGLLRDAEPATLDWTGSLVDGGLGKIPLLAIPDSRFINRAKTSVSSEGDDYVDLARHGAHHFLFDLAYDTTIQTVLAQICIDAWKRNGAKQPPNSPQLHLISKVIQELSGERFCFHRIDNVSSARFTILVDTDSSPGRPILIQHASQGTLSIVAICGLIYQFLRTLHPSAAEAELCQREAIIVIDEVDAHLHPAWQRKIVHVLRTFFPGVQFILTAHSPLVVAGCGRGEVAVLRRLGDNLDVVEYQRHFIGARPEDIYREIFQVEQWDVAFLDLQAQLPQLPQMRRQLQLLRSSSKRDEVRIQTIEEAVESIESTRKAAEAQLEVEALERENEQLKRQLEALRKRDSPTPS